MTDPSVLRNCIWLPLALALFVGCSMPRAQQLSALSDARSIEDFNNRIQTYINVHHQAEEHSGLTEHPLALSSVKEIAKRKHILAKQIVLLRKDTHEGDIFTSELKAYFIRVLNSAYQANPEAISTAAACAPKCDQQMVAPNAIYPDLLGFSMMTPTLLLHLPPLPEELEYRILNRDLIIRDREANLIVDVMRNALAAPPESTDCND